MTEAQATILATVVGVGLGGMVTFLIAWGRIAAKGAESDRRISQLEESRDELREKISKLGDSYVGYQHFNEVVQTMRDNYKDLKADLAKVLDALNAR